MIRDRKLKEKRVASVLKDIAVYAVFLVFLLSLSGQNRNQNAFRVNQHLHRVFKEGGAFDEVYCVFYIGI